MPGGIIVFGANGSGKSSLGRELARTIHYKYMDIEAYHFIKSVIPYTVARSREDCQRRLLADIKKHPSFVLSAVTGAFGKEITSMYRCAVFLSAPLDVRMERIRQREYVQHGERIRKGGDMHQQHLKFLDFVASRSLARIEQWAQTLACPVIRVDGTEPLVKNVEYIVKQSLPLLSAATN